jgi:hypothetical protein
VSAGGASDAAAARAPLQVAAVQQLAVQQRHVHQTGVGRVEDGAVLATPARPAHKNTHI